MELFEALAIGLGTVAVVTAACLVAVLPIAVLQWIFGLT